MGRLKFSKIKKYLNIIRKKGINSLPEKFRKELEHHNNYFCYIADKIMGANEFYLKNRKPEELADSKFYSQKGAEALNCLKYGWKLFEDQEIGLQYLLSSGKISLRKVDLLRARWYCLRHEKVPLSLAGRLTELYY